MFRKIPWARYGENWMFIFDDRSFEVLTFNPGFMVVREIQRDEPPPEHQLLDPERNRFKSDALDPISELREALKMSNRLLEAAIARVKASRRPIFGWFTRTTCNDCDCDRRA